VKAECDTISALFSKILTKIGNNLVIIEINDTNVGIRMMYDEPIVNILDYIDVEKYMKTLFKTAYNIITQMLAERSPFDDHYFGIKDHHPGLVFQCHFIDNFYT